MEGNWQATEVGLQVNLGRETATRAAKRLIMLPPFAPAAETWARTTVESNICTKCAVSLIAARASKASENRRSPTWAVNCPCQQKSAQEIVYSQTMRFRRETASGRSLWLGIEGAASAARVGGSPIGPDD